LLPLWRDRRHWRGPWLGLGALLALVAVISVALLAPREQEPAADRPLAGPLEDYVGSAACQACHPAQHDSWHQSFHRTMTQPASRATVIPQFQSLDLQHFGRSVHLAWNAKVELWVDLTVAGGRRLQRPVVQLTGSHTFQVFWYSTGNQRELAMVPLVYRIDEQRWMPISAAFVLPPEVREPPGPGTWNQNCQGCHATASRPRVDIGRMDTMAGEFGIACEACHGPGKDHVNANRNPLRRYALHLGGGSDDTVIDPPKLEPRRSAQVCGQCHSVSIVRRQWFDAWREHGSPYRPGQDLDASVRVLDPTQTDAPELQRRLQQEPHFFANSFWPDGTVRLSGREYNGLVRSPCYLRGKGEKTMTCLSCHQMHKAAGDARPVAEWTDDQLKEGMRGNSACTQCHDKFASAAALTAHTHHAEGSSGSNCYNCHMSYTSYGLLKALRSHTIESPRVQTELDTGRPNACNQCHLDRTLAWTNEHLQRDWGIVPAALDADQGSIAASVRWLLSGDAGLRALSAWSMGWADAQLASGTDWMAPYLGQLLADPYLAVRFLAERSLRSLPVHAPEHYDFLEEGQPVRAAAEDVQRRWAAAFRGGTARPELLLTTQGLDRATFSRLLARRDDKPVRLSE
jgi:hypothetical protein